MNIYRNKPGVYSAFGCFLSMKKPGVPNIGGIPGPLFLPNALTFEPGACIISIGKRCDGSAAPPRRNFTKEKSAIWRTEKA